MIRPVIPARKVSQGRRSDRGAFLQDVSIGDSSSVSKDTITARTVEKKKNVHFFFFFFPESGRPWQSGDNEAKWQRGEEKVWCVTRIPERTWIWSSR